MVLDRGAVSPEAWLRGQGSGSVGVSLPLPAGTAGGVP
jgi:hypothetical protein